MKTSMLKNFFIAATISLAAVFGGATAHAQVVTTGGSPNIVGVDPAGQPSYATISLAAVFGGATAHAQVVTTGGSPNIVGVDLAAQPSYGCGGCGAVADAGDAGRRPGEPLFRIDVILQTANRIRHTGTAYTELNPPHEVGSTVWGPIIGFTGPRPDAPSPFLFGLNLNGVPSNECLPLLSDVNGRFVDIWVAGAGHRDIGGSVYTRGHLDMVKARAACAAHERLGIDFISR